MHEALAYSLEGSTVSGWSTFFIFVSQLGRIRRAPANGCILEDGPCLCSGLPAPIRLAPPPTSPEGSLSATRAYCEGTTPGGMRMTRTRGEDECYFGALERLGKARHYLQRRQHQILVCVILSIFPFTAVMCLTRNTGSAVHTSVRIRYGRRSCSPLRRRVPGSQYENG
ncbi:AKR_collapsed_G0005690.mRNA.1.CDS.1 [Saccharomyces cerevisiae]|nr:AKR_collapsed_G0005690.mRNA.1.CDS.1 [Saccharomyces cerevisiae]